MAIGHVRYSTTGGGSWENTQPVWRDDGREVALAHNGNLTNAVELCNELREQGVGFRGTSDSEIIAALLSIEPARPIENAVAAVMRLQGAYSTVVMTKRAVVAFRDPNGVRPLALGKLGDRFCVASESCAFDIIGAELMRDLQPGELVALTADGLETRQIVPAERRAHCVFEHIYFPSGLAAGGTRPAAGARRMGEILWREVAGRRRPGDLGPRLGQPRRHGLRAGLRAAQGRRADQEPLRRPDLHPAGAGAAQARPTDEVQSAAGDRVRAADRGRRLDRARQHHPSDRRHAARRRGAGGPRISAPPIRHPCHYGIDMPTREEMVAHERTEAEVATEVGADTLAYLSLEGVYEAVGAPREAHCDACFTGDYPLGDGGEVDGKFALEALPVVQG